MFGIRAHVDGSIIVPDEPLPASIQSEVVVLCDSSVASGLVDLNETTRQYYQSLGQDTDDEAWGQMLADDSRTAWNQE